MRFSVVNAAVVEEWKVVVCLFESYFWNKRSFYTNTIEIGKV